ncbi:MAG: histidine kinase [Marmoricola sp.]|nr:histidine kinase [Marmoricola sp.]
MRPIATWHPPHYRRSLASRVTLLTTMAVGFVVTAVAFAAYATVRMQSMESIDRSLHTRAAAAAKPGPLTALAQRQVPAWALGAGDVMLVVIDADLGRALATTDKAASDQVGDTEYRVARGQDSWSARTVTIHGVRYRAVAVPVQDSAGEALVLSQSLASTDRMLGRLGLVMLLFGLAGMISAALAGWGVARNGLRPVRRLTTRVEDIARTERLDPIPVEGRDEVARLSTAFNAMLAALSASQARQRQLVADAGHELRTPLTSLRTNLDLLAQADTSAKLSAESRKELLDDVRAQISEMTTLIVDLVELARDDPSAAPSVEPVELAAVVSQAVTRVRRRAPTVHFDVHTDPWWVTGDAAALERAITNLLDNAAKWSPEDGRVTVALSQGTVVVSDQGPGIADEDLPHVFDRFYRSAESRGMPGSGLGLSIVKAVADRHGGEVQAGGGLEGRGAAFRFHVPGTMAPPEVLARS